MPKNRWIPGEVVNAERPVWGPLKQVVGQLSDDFMWMYEIRLEDGRAVHAYKNIVTRAYLHLDLDCHCYIYRGRDEISEYRQLDLVDMPTAVWQPGLLYHRSALM